MEPTCRTCNRRTWVIFEREPWCRGHFLERVGEPAEDVQAALDEADAKAAAAAAAELEGATA